ncbi:hypothetical protein A2Z67_02450 [Candidatus Woesebacteria bacterium RBG_13_36_22]|uniref:Uncharacterized protein n=1 Tax=Candidatus Woesebacteria bacterium RBG_13_36_22 TaxID=1802478 RepID=A0A1F7X3G1_9BACT|nr:MAG: hypothetical protein A2Z67_02450 [Candidatus Woesebacteria bacterium RBG_13_36_22]
MQEYLLKIIKATKGFKKGKQFIGFERLSVLPNHYITINEDNIEKTIPKKNCKVLATSIVKREKNNIL